MNALADTLAGLIKRLNDATIEADTALDTEYADRQLIAERLLSVAENVHDDLQNIADQISDCRERLGKDVARLETYPTGDDASPTLFAINCARAEGVSLALSRLDEMLRD